MIKVFKPYLKQIYAEKYSVMIGFLLVMLAGIAGIALFALAGWFICAAAFAGISLAAVTQFNYLLPGAAVRLFAYIRIASRYGERVVNHDITFRLISKLRIWLFNHLTYLSPQQLKFTQNGDLLNRFVTDIGAMDNLLLRLILPFCSVFLLGLSIIILLCFFNVTIAVITFLLISIYLAVIFTLLRINYSDNRTYQRSLNHLRRTITNTAETLKEIFVFNAVKAQIDLFDQNLKDISLSQKKLSRKIGLAQALLTAGMGIILIIAVLLTTRATINKQLNGANIAVVVFILLALSELLQSIIPALGLLGQTTEAATNINRVMATSSLFSAPLNASVTVGFSPQQIKFSHVFFNYDINEKPIFKEFNLTIPPGNHLIITGKSGSGKTTFINLLARFIIPQAGEITVGAKSIYALTDQQWQAIFCIVPQQPYLFDTTLRENLLLANPAATDEMCLQALAVCQLKDFSQSLPNGLSTYVGKNGERLSGGQIRRLAIARAILKNAPITILDEPTEGLDYLTEKALIQALQKYFAEKTLIIVSHRAAVITSFSTVKTKAYLQF